MPTRVLVATEHAHGLPLTLRDAGFEVIYVGPQPAEALLAAAEQEDVAAIVVTGEVPGAKVPVIDASGLTAADVLSRLQ